MKRFRDQKRRGGGFTLIELLVVVAIIALLISILLPSLAEAREQAKISVCLANLRTLGQATVGYLIDNDDNFPFRPKYENEEEESGNAGICSWSYAGKTSDEFWKTDSRGVFYFMIQERPLNRYMLGAVPEFDRMNGNNVEKRTEMYLMRCPSDRVSHQRFFHDVDNEGEGLNCYDDVGTSYHYSLHAMLRGSSFDVYKGELNYMQMNGYLWYRNGWSIINRALINQVMNFNPSTYVMYMEDPMDFAAGNRVQRIGNHRKFSKHTAAFIDGHASYKMFDTRGFCGPGWHLLNPSWIVYEGQGHPEPFHYKYPSPRNCDPIP
ncbi:MAG: prepilin-type N-terminal cleavage/methylation domain-containing protein [Phycisphaerae bacterium]|jgi:prepilin-type N-terminal cleavage/methylation domain-containing protein